MARNQTVGSLSIVGVISAGLRIYRDHFQDYFTIGLQAYCWIIIPIYGWAKFIALSALISRLAYHEILEQPEAISQARPRVERKMWSFLGQGILVTLIMMGAITVLIILEVTALMFLVGILGQNNPITYLIGFGVSIAALCAYLAIVSRFLIASVPLAVEDNMTATEAISRSRKLTKGSVLWILGIVFLEFLIIFPPLLILDIFSITFVNPGLATILGSNSSIYNLIVNLFAIARFIIGGALAVPFRQSIYGVIYCDLKFKELRDKGIDLKINPIKDRESGV